MFSPLSAPTLFVRNIAFKTAAGSHEKNTALDRLIFSLLVKSSNWQEYGRAQIPRHLEL